MEGTAYSALQHEIDQKNQLRHDTVLLEQLIRKAIGIDSEPLLTQLLKLGTFENAEAIRERGIHIHEAAIQGFTDVAEYYRKKKVNLHAGNHQSKIAKPLYYASMYDRPEAVIFIQHGGNPNARNYDRETPLTIAIKKDNSAMVQLLVDYGADVNICNNNGTSALMTAVKNQNEQIVKILLINGAANINLTTKSGATALEYATRNNNHRIIALLQANTHLQSQRETIFQSCAQGDLQVVKDIVSQGFSS